MHQVGYVRSRDSEEFSHALKDARVSAVQISKGTFLGELHWYAVGEWRLQHLSFVTGSTSCAGEAPSDRNGFFVPLSHASGSRLLGQPLTATSIGIYNPRGEHADVTMEGSQHMVIVPPQHFFTRATEDHETAIIPGAGSHHGHGSVESVASLKAVLRDIHMAAVKGEMPFGHPEIVRSIESCLTAAVLSAASPQRESSPAGRPAILRRALLRKIEETLVERGGEPIYANELCVAVGVSHPTLQRVFLEWFGMPPARYLLLKRLYLARSRLRSNAYRTVGEAAASCGFWELSRFSKRYKEQFGETPSQTMRRRQLSSLP